MNSLDQTQKFYNTNKDLVTGLLTAGFFTMDEKLKILKFMLGQMEQCSVLDLGCGLASMCGLVRIAGAKSYTGIDLERSNIEEAQLHYPTEEFWVWDCCNLPGPLSRRKFDVVLLLDVLEHLNPQKIMQAICSVTKVGSRLLISAPNYLNFAGLVKLFNENFGNYNIDSWAPFSDCKPQIRERMVTSVGIRRLTKQYGFRFITSLGFDVIAATYPWIYGKNELRGFVTKYPRIYSTVNRWAMWKCSPITQWFSMYYLVSCKK